MSPAAPQRHPALHTSSSTNCVYMYFVIPRYLAIREAQAATCHAAALHPPCTRIHTRSAPALHPRCTRAAPLLRPTHCAPHGTSRARPLLPNTGVRRRGLRPMVGGAGGARGAARLHLLRRDAVHAPYAGAVRGARAAAEASSLRVNVNEVESMYSRVGTPPAR
eukprot:scaffold21976_cov56-Phaeocystis_antarctica.AAC.6